MAPIERRVARRFATRGSAIGRFGGIQSSAGYGFDTKYEVAAANMGEALHCILGSVNRADPEPAERNHVREEIGIIEDRVDWFQNGTTFRTPQDILDQISGQGPYSEYADSSIDAMQKNSKRLIGKIPGLVGETRHLTPPNDEIARRAYETLMGMAEAILKALREASEEDVTTAAFLLPEFQNPLETLKEATRKLA